MKHIEEYTSYDLYEDAGGTLYLKSKTTGKLYRRTVRADGTFRFIEVIDMGRLRPLDHIETEVLIFDDSDPDNIKIYPENGI